MSEQWLPSGSDQQTESERLDEELQRQIQWKLEACKKAEDLHRKLTEMESVLEWASDNVLSAWGNYTDSKKWSAFVKPSEPQEATTATTAPTLYDALYSAWKERGEVKP